MAEVPYQSLSLLARQITLFDSIMNAAQYDSIAICTVYTMIYNLGGRQLGAVSETGNPPRTRWRALKLLSTANNRTNGTYREPVWKLRRRPIRQVMVVDSGPQIHGAMHGVQLPSFLA